MNSIVGVDLSGAEHLLSKKKWDTNGPAIWNGFQMAVD